MTRNKLIPVSLELDNVSNLKSNKPENENDGIQKNIGDSRDKISTLVHQVQNDNSGIEYIEHKNGFPVIRSEEYSRIYNTDIRALGDDGAATFNFRGYIREDRPGFQKGVFFKDALATNGILKSNGHEGIHIGIDGVISYDGPHDNHQMKGPEDIGEYVVYIEVPTELQRELEVVVSNDSCVSALSLSADEVEDLYAFQEQMAKDYKTPASSYIVVRLDLNPKKDKLARDKVVLIHTKIIQYIESGKPLYLLQDIIRNLEEDLKNISK